MVAKNSHPSPNGHLQKRASGLLRIITGHFALFVNTTEGGFWKTAASIYSMFLLARGSLISLFTFSSSSIFTSYGRVLCSWCCLFLFWQILPARQNKNVSNSIFLGIPNLCFRSPVVECRTFSGSYIFQILFCLILQPLLSWQPSLIWILFALMSCTNSSSITRDTSTILKLRCIVPDPLHQVLLLQGHHPLPHPEAKGGSQRWAMVRKVAKPGWVCFLKVIFWS